MIEVIIMLGVLIAITSMAFPDIVGFFRQQQQKQDELSMLEIRKAVESYAKSEKKLPNDATWFDDLAKFSNMDPNGIRYDVWGNERHYQVYSETKTYRDGDVEIFYSSITSPGMDQFWREDTDNDGVGDTPLDSPYDWSESVDGYANYEAKGDDLVVKYTDLEIKTIYYDETLVKMESIVKALERYATGYYNEAILGEVDNIQTLIFYPIANDPVRTRYYTKVQNDMQTIAGKYNLIPGNENDMKALMRIIGLPETYAIDSVTGNAFYYYSNPDVGTNCVNNRASSPYLPPRLTRVPCNTL